MNGIMYVRPEGEGARRHAASDSDVMGWLLFGSLLFWPRLFILGFWIFGSTLDRAFSSAAIPVIGFFVAPWTTFGYAMMWGISSDKVTGWEWAVVGVCVLLDLATYAVGARRLSSR